MRGAAWMVALRISDRLIGLVSLFVLARLLVPADFGLVALVNALIGLIALLGAFGFDTALVQNRHSSKAEFDTVFTFNVMFGLAMAGVLVALAVPTADFYADGRIVNVVLALAGARLIGAFENVGMVQFRKDLAFEKEFQLTFFKRIVVTFVVTLPLAFYWGDYRALVAGTLAGSVVGVVLSYVLHPYRPRFGLSAWRGLFGFSKWMLATNLVGFAYARMADFIIGRLLGPAALGVYSLSKEISKLPSSELAAPMQRAVFSGYAQISDDIDALRKAYLRVVSILSLVVMPAAIGLCLVASPLVHVFLGDKWLEAIPIIRILAIEGILVVGVSSAYYVYLTLGTPQKLTAVMALHAVVSIVLMLMLIPIYGIFGAAVAWVTATIATAPVNLTILARHLHMRYSSFAAAIARPTAATIVMAMTVALLQWFWVPATGALAAALQLAASVAVGVCAYALALFGLWHVAGRPDGAERSVLQRARLFLPTRTAKGS